jgi:acetyltransferase-like isoleucine patch superfamily enzyme
VIRHAKYTTIGACAIHRTATIRPGAIVGKPFRPLLTGAQDPCEKTTICARVYLGYYALIGAGSRVGLGSMVDDFCLVESRVRIGRSTLVIYRAQICNDSHVGDDCVIGGFIGERTRIGDHCRVFGQLVHSQHDPTRGWDDDEAEEGSPIIESRAFVGFSAIVAGKVTVGEGAYVCAGATITRNVPAKHVAFGANKIISYRQWKGELKFSPFFKTP